MPKVSSKPRADATAFEPIREAMTARVALPIWWEIPGSRPRRLDYAQACRTCRFVRRSARNRRLCQRQFLKAIDQAARQRMPHQFLCPIQRYAVVLPLQSNGAQPGYLALCHSEQAFSGVTLALAGVAAQACLGERQRVRELQNLSETIQPRCVALSTIHTIHRLINSTLDLQELVPRVARLCCQVLRAQRCSIWLLDKDRRIFVPKAVVDLGKASAKPPLPFRSGQGTLGQVASSWKPWVRGRRMAFPMVDEECVGVLRVQRLALGEPFSPLDQEILTTLAEQAVIAIRNAQMYEAQERVTWGTIKSLSAMLEGMDTTAPGGTSHSRVMAEVSLAIAQQMKLSEPLQKALHYAALLHDAGRVGIPGEILHKPAKLEPAEYAKVKEHLVKGASLLQPINLLEPAIPIILHHHERYDGTGYPNGLKKEAIPVGARILGVANAFEAMVCERPYRKALSVEEAAQEIASHAGTQFDPKVVEAFLELVRSKKLELLIPKGLLKEKQQGAGG